MNFIDWIDWFSFISLSDEPETSKPTKRGLCQCQLSLHESSCPECYLDFHQTNFTLHHCNQNTAVHCTKHCQIIVSSFTFPSFLPSFSCLTIFSQIFSHLRRSIPWLISWNKLKIKIFTQSCAEMRPILIWSRMSPFSWIRTWNVKSRAHSIIKSIFSIKTFLVQIIAGQEWEEFERNRINYSCFILIRQIITVCMIITYTHTRETMYTRIFWKKRIQSNCHT